MTVADFIVANPGISFCLSWPVAIVLIVGAVLFTNLLTSAMNLILHLVTKLIDGVVIAIRGYQALLPAETPEETRE